MNFFPTKRKSIFLKRSEVDTTKCTIQGHNSNHLIAICPNPNCNQHRLMCSKCMQTLHKNHSDSHLKLDEILNGKKVLKHWPLNNYTRLIGQFLYSQAKEDPGSPEKSLETQIDEFFDILQENIRSKIEEARVMIKCEYLDETVADGMKLAKLLSRYEAIFGLKDLKMKIEKYLMGASSLNDTENELKSFFTKDRYGDEENLKYVFNSIKNKPDVLTGTYSKVPTKTILDIHEEKYESFLEKITEMLNLDSFRTLLEFKQENSTGDTMTEEDQSPFETKNPFIRVDFLKPIYQLNHAHVDQITNMQVLTIPNTKEKDTTISHSLIQKPFDHFLITTSEDKSIKVWDLANKRLEYSIDRAHEDWVLSLAVIKLTNGEMKSFKKNIEYLMITGSTDGTLRSWDWAKGELVSEIKNAHQGWISQLELLKADEKQLRTLSASLNITKILVSASWDKVIKLWDWTSFRCLKVIQTGIKTYAFALISYDERRVSQRKKSLLEIRRFSLTDTKKLPPIYGSFSSDRSDEKSEKLFAIANAGWDCSTIKIWNWLGGNCIQELKGKCERYNSLIAIPVKDSGDDTQGGKERQLLAAAGYYQNHCIEIWDWEKATCLKIIERAHDDWIKSLKVLPIKRSFVTQVEWALVSGSGDNSIKLWSVTSEEPIKVFQKHYSTAREGALLPWVFEMDEERQSVLIATHHEGQSIVIFGEDELEL